MNQDPIEPSPPEQDSLPIGHSLGQWLAAAREQQGISIEQAAKDIHMRVQLLRDLEKDDLSNFSNPSYARMFLIAYTRYLGRSVSQVSAYLPPKGIPSAEGYDYLKRMPDSSRFGRKEREGRGFQNRRSSQHWLQRLALFAIIAILVSLGVLIVYLTLNLPRLTSAVTSVAQLKAAEASGTSGSSVSSPAIATPASFSTHALPMPATPEEHLPLPHRSLSWSSITFQSFQHFQEPSPVGTHKEAPSFHYASQLDPSLSDSALVVSDGVTAFDSKIPIPRAVPVLSPGSDSYSDSYLFHPPVAQPSPTAWPHVKSP